MIRPCTNINPLYIVIWCEAPIGGNIENDREVKFLDRLYTINQIQDKVSKFIANKFGKDIPNFGWYFIDINPL